MKKTAAVIIVLSLILSLLACGCQAQPEVSERAPTPEEIYYDGIGEYNLVSNLLDAGSLFKEINKLELTKNNRPNKGCVFSLRDKTQQISEICVTIEQSLAEFDIGTNPEIERVHSYYLKGFEQYQILCGLYTACADLIDSYDDTYVPTPLPEYPDPAESDASNAAPPSESDESAGPVPPEPEVPYVLPVETQLTRLINDDISAAVTAANKYFTDWQDETRKIYNRLIAS